MLQITKCVDVTVKGSDVYHVADVIHLDNGTDEVIPYCGKPDRSGKYQPYYVQSYKRMCGRCKRAMGKR